MASFVQEVLSATGRLNEKEDYLSKASRLKNKVDDLKFSLRERIESRYEDFSASFVEVSTTVAQLEEVLRDVENLENSINTHVKAGLLDAGRDAGAISRQLKDLSQSVQLANLTRKAFDDLEEGVAQLENKKYLEAAEKLKIVGNVVNNMDLQDDEDTKQSLKAIRKEHDSVKQKISYILCKDWDENVKIIPNFKDNDDQLDFTLLELNLKFSGEENLTQKLVEAMNLSDVLPFRQQKFAQNLLNYLFKPIITKMVRLEVKDPECITLHIKENNTDENLNPIDVLSHIETICIFLSNHFNFKFEDGSQEFITRIGSQIAQPTMDLLMKQCLIPAVPNNTAHLDGSFNKVIGAVRSFHAAMIRTKFLEDSEVKVLLDFVDNIKQTFVNKRCKSILSQARLLMKKHLHVTENIDETVDAQDIQELLKTKTNIKIDMSLEEELLPLPDGVSLNDNLFQFPSCQVSQSVIELKDLIDKVLNEAIDAKDDVHYCGRLLVTVRNIFEMYNDILPVSHSESLKSFPLNSALGYNNCMYLAHQCLQIFIPSNELPTPLKIRPLTFADLVPKLRQTGIEVFMAQIRRLRDQFRSSIRDSVTGYGQLDGSNLLPQSSEKCMKQVMHQLNHLKSLWQNTLPLSIYRRAIGTILNSIVEELVQRVVVLEDIAADAAVQICTYFANLQDNAPQIFVIEEKKDTSKGDIMRYVKKWNRFKELIIILNASMREIEDRWASGKGPLATEFTADEVKRMVRALFQNTDRRAGVLSRIR